MIFLGTPSHPICGPSSFKCTDDTEYYMTAEEFDSLNSSTKRVCNCLPTCTSITYDYEISQAMMNWKRNNVHGISHRFLNFLTYFCNFKNKTINLF